MLSLAGHILPPVSNPVQPIPIRRPSSEQAKPSGLVPQAYLQNSNQPKLLSAQL
jgi:hypothetical protein